MSSTQVYLEKTYYERFFNNDIDTVLIYEKYCDLFNKDIVHMRDRIDSVVVEFDTATNNPLNVISVDVYIDAYFDAIISPYKEREI